MANTNFENMVWDIGKEDFLESVLNSKYDAELFKNLYFQQPLACFTENSLTYEDFKKMATEMVTGTFQIDDNTKLTNGNRALLKSLIYKGMADCDDDDPVLFEQLEELLAWVEAVK